MNQTRALLVALAAMAVVMAKKSLGFSQFNAPPSSGTPNIPHHNRPHSRPHAPNDGHWHMKFHRGRY